MSGRAMEGRLVSPGPYRATKLWNEVTKYFRAEMPRRKHRQHFKKHGNCFTATEAISWLHELLRSNSNFGPDVTRQQTIQLLRKFLKNHVIEDIKGRWGSENLEDNQNLYRFPSTSPVRILPHRCPLTSKADNTPKETERVFKLSRSSRRTPKKYLFREYQNVEDVNREAMEEEEENATQSRPETQASIEEVWRNLILIHLQTILGIPSLEEVLLPTQVVPQYVMYNMAATSKRGVVLLQDKSEDLPHWVLSAMKCLANWPRSNDMSQPTYMGFERDVFKTVADYFVSLPEPLLTFEYYELFVNILVLCGCITIPNRSSGKSLSQTDLELTKTPHLNSFKSTECLLLSLLHREIGKKDESGTSGSVSRKTSEAEKGCSAKMQQYGVAGKCATVRGRMGGSCQNLSRLKNEQALPLARKTRCFSLEGIVDASSSKSSEDRLKTLPQAGVGLMPFTDHENQHLCPVSQPDTLLDLSSCKANQKQTHSFKGISAPSIPDQDLYSGHHGPKQLRRSQSLRGTRNSRGCGVHAPVAEITVKPHPIVPLSHKIQSTTQAVAKLGSKPGESDLGISKRFCRSTTELSENTFPPSYFMLTGTSSLLQPHLERATIEALQICCLLLPPPNRRKLQLLMRMISRMSENVDMPRLHDTVGTKSLMIQTFSRCILCCEEEVDFDELLATRLVSFLMDHHHEILGVPTYLQVAVQDHIETLRTIQGDCLAEDMNTIFPTYSYCKRITSREFDEQKVSTSQAAIAELLENVIKDRNLSLKDKKKKLKQFQKEYPQIYQNRFPTTESEATLFEGKPTIKQPMLSLRKPKFRGIRH